MNKFVVKMLGLEKSSVFVLAGKNKELSHDFFKKIYRVTHPRLRSVLGPNCEQLNFVVTTVSVRVSLT